jgi:hypothetical protein
MAHFHVSEHHLLGVRSVVGGIVVVASLSVFGFGLQALDDAVRAADGFSVGTPEAVSNDMVFTPAGGWIKNPDQSVTEGGVVAERNGWQIKVAGGIELQPGESLEDFATIFHDIPPSEPETQVTDLTDFTTASGLHGVTWKSHGATTADARWMILNGTEVVQILASGPASSLSAVESELAAMAVSVAAGTQEAGS